MSAAPYRLPPGPRAASRYAAACMRQHRAGARARETVDDFWRRAWWLKVLELDNPELRLGLRMRRHG